MEPGLTTESVARAVISERIGHPLRDEEFKQMRQRLVEFVVTLKRWDDQRRTASAEDKQKCSELNKPAA